MLRLAREIAAAEGPHDGLALTAAAILHDFGVLIAAAAARAAAQRPDPVPARVRPSRRR